MNRYYIKLLDMNVYVIKYKAKKNREFILTISEEDREAGMFDEDDYIIEVCKLHHSVELIPTSILNGPPQIFLNEKFSTAPEQIPTDQESISVAALDWL